MAGKTYQTGIGVPTNSRIEVRNDGFPRFATKVGVDDSATDKANR